LQGNFFFAGGKCEVQCVGHVYWYKWVRCAACA
jgi:hypothetical protein